MAIRRSATFCFLQYSSLAAQYSSPGQQNHPALGQQPPGHTVPSQSCLASFFTIFLGAAIDNIILLKSAFLQYSSLAAQYSSPGQQNHPAFGQQPPGHTVPSQSFLRQPWKSIFQQCWFSCSILHWQHNIHLQDSKTIQRLSNILQDKLYLRNLV